jgi:hypothetical protein
MARRVAGVHTPLSSPSYDPAQLLLQLARDVGILWDRRRPRSRRIAGTRRERDDHRGRRGGCRRAGAGHWWDDGTQACPAPWSLGALTGGRGTGIDLHGRASPAAAEARLCPVGCDRLAAENEDKSAGFSAGELLHARPTGTWHWLVARFPRCRGGSGRWVCGSRSCLALLRRPRRLCHAPETDVTGLYPLVVTPICASSMKAPDTGLQNGLGPFTFLTELSFSLQPTSSLGPSTPARR